MYICTCTLFKYYGRLSLRHNNWQSGQPIETSPRISTVRWQRHSPPCWAMNQVQIVRDWDDKSIVKDRSRVINNPASVLVCQFLIFGIFRLVTLCAKAEYSIIWWTILKYGVAYPPSSSSFLAHHSTTISSSFDRSRSFHPFSTLHQFLSNFGLPYQLYQAKNRGSCARKWNNPPKVDYQRHRQRP